MGPLPPLQLNLGSSATSSAGNNGTTAGGGMGALNEGDWITQVTGAGDNAAIPSAKGGIQSSTLLWVGAGLAVVYFLTRKK